MPNRTRNRAVILAAVLLASCGGTGPPQEPFDEPVILLIERGSRSLQIAEQLEASGVIDSKWQFLWVRARNMDRTLMAGEYRFESPVGADEAFTMIAEGRVILYPITIPEGLNRLEIAELVTESGLVDGQEFLEFIADPAPVKELFPEAETLEGCLFPETYSLARTSTAEDLVNAMVTNFLDALDEARSQKTAEISDWDALILASMIEKEAGDVQERGLVSSVFHNRIGRSMLMQSDPTIIYGLVLEGRYRGRIFLSDLSDPHPYNTYVHEGLPPGPIANPGKQSLQAAYAPAESDFLFFVAKPGFNAGHVFTETLTAHNSAVQALRRFERSQR